MSRLLLDEMEGKEPHITENLFSSASDKAALPSPYLI